MPDDQTTRLIYLVVVLLLRTYTKDEQMKFKADQLAAGSRLEGREFAGAAPVLVDLREIGHALAGAVRRDHQEAVVHPGHLLLLAARYPAEEQPVVG